jgi:tetratricopeptide (TPR) repeat protein
MSLTDWLKWLWQQVEQFVAAHQAILAIFLAILAVIVPFLAWWFPRERQRQKREAAQARAPFEVLRTQEELMAYLFPNPERRVLPDAEIPYLDRVGRELDEALAQKRRLLISGISKCGKTREAAELIRRLRRTQDVTVLALKPNAWLERPDPQRDAWLEQVPKRGLVLLIDDVDGLRLPVATREGAALSSFQDRLQATIEYFETTCGRDELWVLATVLSKAPRWERLNCPDHPLWQDFAHYPLASLRREETESLVERLESTGQIPPVDPQARARIAATNDGTFLRPILFFREKLEEKAPCITPSEAEDFARNLRQEFELRYQRAVEADPHCRHVYAALDLLRQAQVAPYAFLVRELAAGLADRHPWRRFWLQRRIGRALERLTVSEIPCREELLFPYEGQADVAQATLDEGRIDLLSRFLLSLTCRCPYHRLRLLFGDHWRLWLFRCSLYSFGSFLAVERQDYRRAIQMWERAIQLDSKDAGAYDGRGNTYAGLGQHERAIQDYDRAIKLDPKLALAYYSRGLAYAFLGQHQRAIEDYDQAIQLDPKLAMAYTNRGAAYYQLGQYEQAIQDHDQAIQLDPKYAVAYNNRGAAYAALGQHQRAIQDYDQAVLLDPKYAVAYNNRGAAYAALGQHQRAIQDFDQALQLDPKLAAAYYNRGLAYANLGQYERAIQDFDQALQLDPKLAAAYYNRGLAYANLGQYERAIQDYDRAIKLDPKLALAYYSRGLAYAFLGQHQRAIEDYDQAIQLDPKLAWAYGNRGAAYADLGQYQRAIQDYDQAIQLDPKLALAYYSRGFAYAALGQHQRAIQDYDQAIQLAPKLCVAYYNLACVWARQKDVAKALEHLRQAIELNPQAAEWARSDKDFDSIREDPQFRALVGL